MSWYTINHKCGHTSERQIVGTDVRGERQRKADWFGRDDCPDCIKAAQGEQNAADTEYAAASGWPELIGSPKQVAWASSLRADAINRLDQACRNAGLDDADHDALRGILMGQTSAKQWIEFRGGIPSRSRVENLLNLRDYAPLGELLRNWSADPDKGVVETFLERVSK